MSIGPAPVDAQAVVLVHGSGLSGRYMIPIATKLLVPFQLSDRIEDKAPCIQAPTLVVRGEHDPIANRQWCELIARLCRLGRLQIIPGVAHTLCFTAPVQLAAATRNFVKEARAA